MACHYEETKMGLGNCQVPYGVAYHGVRKFPIGGTGDIGRDGAKCASIAMLDRIMNAMTGLLSKVVRLVDRLVSVQCVKI